MVDEIPMENHSLTDIINLKELHNFLYPLSQDTISQLLGLLGDECSCNKLNSLHGIHTAEDITSYPTDCRTSESVLT